MCHCKKKKSVFSHVWCHNCELSRCLDQRCCKMPINYYFRKILLSNFVFIYFKFFTKPCCHFFVVFCCVLNLNVLSLKFLLIISKISHPENEEKKWFGDVIVVMRGSIRKYKSNLIKLYLNNTFPIKKTNCCTLKQNNINKIKTSTKI